MKTTIALVGLGLALLSPASSQESVAQRSKEEIKSEWRAARRGPLIQLNESEDGISAVFRKNRRYSVTYELKELEDGSYRGFAAEEFSCWADHFCRIETPMQAVRVDDNRIEGRIFGTVPPKGIRRGNLYCETCGKSEEQNASWMEFVWLRAE